MTKGSAETAKEILVYINRRYGGNPMYDSTWIEGIAEIIDRKSSSPAMYEALKAVIPRLAHKGKCVTPNPTEEWATRDSCNFDNCDCEVSIVEKAIRLAEEGQ